MTQKVPLAGTAAGGIKVNPPASATAPRAERDCAGEVALISAILIFWAWPRFNDAIKPPMIAQLLKRLLTLLFILTLSPAPPFAIPSTKRA